MHIKTSSISGGRFRKQTRRALPLYIACGLLLLIYTQIDHFERFQRTPGEVLKRIMAHQQPVHREKNSKFPKKIWQTWKTDPLDFEVRESDRARTWPQLNPGHRYEVLTDNNDLAYVEEHFGPNGVIYRPDIVETYRTLNATIIKADLLRYLIMYAEGGVYADIDVENLRGIDTWIPKHFDESDVDLVISVEIDEPGFANHKILGQKSQSFCQWTFMAKPQHPVMLKLVDHVLHWLNEVAQKQAVPISGIKLNFDEVITGTGPSAFTNAVLSEMVTQTHRRIYWDTFHALTQPVLVGNILVLTVDAFAAGQGHSNSLSHDSPNALVRHHYHASLWPSRHPRFSHPAYGMVEECNWEPTCVEDWTKNTAAFNSLPYDERARLIQAKEKVDKEAEEDEIAEQEIWAQEELDRQALETKIQCELASYVHVENLRAPTPTPDPATLKSPKDQAATAQELEKITQPGTQMQRELQQ
ncbi:glycosyltransferase sugar-binding region containing DXD domain-containing protein [Drepanopeziza brunnea f. sp. 'multigermtubi' MB_m1]|uniref:Glycosyltransferase sugar-binding region containing DXD domain-containing protein n=1 Tax=Marssonina brunnea f. sp. multigermtubi (strain MB_m1) TaxID=1072389 RepID=K1XNB1_MARBU|nr:glycosyltransferase sugar-binding region containing DXD domain-containing protein [Drepanopeziza brunnea f. sp. 'multigermtubi' MB_m1]EKD13984.1 glycosyltransferase sugar-binding region containing DXD domain-containing protein [Drepanopeziza brunnea f. sp. 'multigermtubi' MB_m1]